MDAELQRRLASSGYGAAGFAERYDAVRPRPPAALPGLLAPLVGTRLRRVVDLGGGTGLSTRAWAEHADEVVGVEPQAAMRHFAERATSEANVRYVDASAYETGLPDACADLVTAAQSLQWMRPALVFPEVARVLRPDGVFCAYEYVALQTPLWEPERAYRDVRARVRALRAERGLDDGRELWPPSAERLEGSGVFRAVRETSLHSLEEGDGDRLVELALSEGSLATLLAAGVTEVEVGLDALRRAAAAMPTPVPWWLSYRAWLGLR